MEYKHILFKSEIIKDKNDSIKESSIIKIFASIVYIFLFQYIYINYLYTEWEYFGYNLYNNTIPRLFLCISISLIPVLFYRGILRISSYFAILIYVLAYVPIITTLTYNTLGTFLVMVTTQLALMFGMILFFIADRIKVKAISQLMFKKKIPFFFIHIITAVLSIYLLVLFKDKVRFVSFDKIYELRSSNDALSNNGLNGYFIMWLSYCFYPLYFTIGIINKNIIYIITGIIGSIFIYTITGAKASLLTPLIIFSIYKLLSLRSRFSFFQLFIISLSSLSGLIFAGGKILSMVGTIFFMRTLSMPGLLTSQYVDFFENHKYTFYTHINIINTIFGTYPYGKEPLGKVVGYHYFNSEINSNAIFWATDGIAAMGQMGIIFISVIVLIFLLLLDSLLKNNVNLFTIVIFTPPILIMLNGSFFSTLLSGGLLFLVIILQIFKFPIEDNLYGIKWNQEDKIH